MKSWFIVIILSTCLILIAAQVENEVIQDLGDFIRQVQPKLENDRTQTDRRESRVERCNEYLDKLKHGDEGKLIVLSLEARSVLDSRPHSYR